MGTFTYGIGDVSRDVDDRVLAHLQLVIVQKLRRGERFLFRCETEQGASGSESFWMAAEIPVTFTFDASRTPRLNLPWLQRLARSAQTVDGLWIVPEPTLVREPVVASEPEHARSRTVAPRRRLAEVR